MDDFNGHVGKHIDAFNCVYEGICISELNVKGMSGAYLKKYALLA